MEWANVRAGVWEALPCPSGFVLRVEYEDKTQKYRAKVNGSYIRSHSEERDPRFIQRFKTLADAQNAAVIKAEQYIRQLEGELAGLTARMKADGTYKP